jgi:Fe-S cluster assembly scaffold protein SufB
VETLNRAYHNFDVVGDHASGTVGSIAFSSCNRHIGTLVMTTQNGFP